MITFIYDYILKNKCIKCMILMHVIACYQQAREARGRPGEARRRVDPTRAHGRNWAAERGGGLAEHAWHSKATEHGCEGKGARVQ